MPRARRRLRGARRRRGRQRGADGAQRLRDLRRQHGGGPARRLRRADQLALHGGGGGLHPGRLPRQGAGDPCRPAAAGRRRHAGRHDGAGRADAAGDRRCLWRAGGEARRAAGRRELGRLRRPQRAQHPAAEALARQHDLHLGHDRPAQGRQAAALDARAAGRRGGRDRQALGHRRRSLDRRADERADVPLGAGRLRPQQRADRAQHRAAAALRGRGHAAADRPAQGHAHAHRADHVRAPAAAAGRGEGEDTTCRRCAGSRMAPRPARRR